MKIEVGSFNRLLSSNFKLGLLWIVDKFQPKVSLHTISRPCSPMQRRVTGRRISRSNDGCVVRHKTFQRHFVVLRRGHDPLTLACVKRGVRIRIRHVRLLSGCFFLVRTSLIEFFTSLRFFDRRFFNLFFKRFWEVFDADAISRKRTFLFWRIWQREDFVVLFVFFGKIEGFCSVKLVTINRMIFRLNFLNLFL